MPPWLQLAAVLLLAGLGVAFVQPELWLKASFALVPVFSIIGAAVLFRLGRGLPNFEVASLSAAEVRRLATAYRIAARNTAAILVVLFLAVCSAVLPSVWDGKPPKEPGFLLPSLAFIGIALTALVVVRTVELVRGDLSLIRLQAKLLEQNTKGQHTAANKARRERGRKDAPVSKPPGYGDLASHD